MSWRVKRAFVDLWPAMQKNHLGPNLSGEAGEPSLDSNIFSDSGPSSDERNPRVASSSASTDPPTRSENFTCPAARQEARGLSATVDNGRLAQPEASGTEERLPHGLVGRHDAQFPGRVDATVSAATPLLHHFFTSPLAAPHERHGLLATSPRRCECAARPTSQIGGEVGAICV